MIQLRRNEGRVPSLKEGAMKLSQIMPHLVDLPRDLGPLDGDVRQASEQWHTGKASELANCRRVQGLQWLFK